MTVGAGWLQSEGGREHVKSRRDRNREGNKDYLPC
jgi:hypothetical protein